MNGEQPRYHRPSWSADEVASQPKIVCFISRVFDAREREQSFKVILYTIYKSEKENGKIMIIFFQYF